MEQNLKSSITADKVNTKKVKWTNFANKVWQRELILLFLHQEGPITKFKLADKGFQLYLVDRHLHYLIKKGKARENKETLEYSRTSKKHKFHYNRASGKLE